MNESFLHLFSDEAATPRLAFVESLHNSVLRTAGVPATRSFLRRLSTRLLISIILTVVIAALTAALVFLPRRDMSDPSKDSVIESIVSSSKDNATNFVTPTQVPASPENENPNKPTGQSEVTSPNTTASMPTPSMQQQPAAMYLVQYWNMPADGVAYIPDIEADYQQSVSGIDFVWGVGSPHPNIDTDHFMARATQSIVLEPGSYKVSYEANDGIRMVVNETVLFDHWQDGVGSGTASFMTDPAMPATVIEIDFLELSGLASWKVIIQKI